MEILENVFQPAIRDVSTNSISFEHSERLLKDRYIVTHNSNGTALYLQNVT